MKKALHLSSIILLLVATAFISREIEAQTLNENPELDKKVEKFLAERSGRW